MNDLNIPGTQTTPSIVSDHAQGVLAIAGDSYPENSFEFFTATIEWIEGYLAGSDRPLHLELRLIYMNTSSVKAMMDIFDLLEEAHGKGRKVSVDWFYNPRNERVEMLAEEVRVVGACPFNIAARE